MKTLLPFACLALVAIAAAGCNDIPIGDLQSSFHLKVNVPPKNSAPVKVDFLWVIDDSASMCQEQAALAASADEFLNRIQNFVNMDYRLAVVTTDVLSDDKCGLFQYNKITEYPFACAEARIQECLPDTTGDASCAGGFGTGWACDGPDKPKQVVNCNDTFNSKCKRACSADVDCDSDPQLAGAFNADGTLDTTRATQIAADRKAKCSANPADCVYKCLKPSGDPKNTGCVLRPGTKTCPETDVIRQKMEEAAEGQHYLVGGSSTAQTASELFKCVAIVGAQQHNNANLESGIAATLLALDKTGVRAEQAKAFLRDDAYLVIVIVSDEEDCSTGDYYGPDCDPSDSKCGKTHAGLIKLKKEQYGTCACLKDADDPTSPGPLRSVTDAVNRIKALKSDPGKVVVAAIVGDSTQTDPAAKQAERDGYFASKCSKCEDPAKQHPLLFNTYVCSSPTGKADYGSRYVELVKRFGQNGIATNICASEGISPALETIGNRIISVFTKICLPRPVGDGSTVVVTTYGPGGTCGDGSACTDEGDACADGSDCVPTTANVCLADSAHPDCIEGYTIGVSSDCLPGAEQKAIFFNYLLQPNTGVAVGYNPPPAATPSNTK